MSLSLQNPFAEHVIHVQIQFLSDFSIFMKSENTLSAKSNREIEHILG